MTITTTCWKCEEEFQFETDVTPKLLLEEVQIKRTDKFVVKCPHCGTENVVEIEP